MVGAPWNPTVTDYPALDGVDLTDAVVTARSDSGDALYFTSTDGLGDGTTGVDTLYRLDLEDTSVSTVFETGDLHLGLNDGAGTCEMALQAITPTSTRTQTTTAIPTTTPMLPRCSRSASCPTTAAVSAAPTAQLRMR